MNFYKKPQLTTPGHTQLPRGGVAKVSSLGNLAGNPTRKRSESATAHTGERCKPF
jgi:hypothetical protein